MSLRGDAEALRRGHGRQSQLPIILDALPPDEQAELLEMLDDPLCTGAMIAAALKLRKVEISPSTVLNWKRGVGRGGR